MNKVISFVVLFVSLISSDQSYAYESTDRPYRWVGAVLAYHGGPKEHTRMTCNGVVIDQYLVVTAAHCVPENWNGNNVVFYKYSEGKSYNVIKMWRDTTYDWAILQTSEQVSDTWPAIPSYEHSDHKIEDGLVVRVDVSKPKVPFLINDEWFLNIDLTPTQMWSSECKFKLVNEGYRTDECNTSVIGQGNSGGPLFSHDEKLGWVLYGINSHYRRGDNPYSTRPSPGYSYFTAAYRFLSYAKEYAEKTNL